MPTVPSVSIDDSLWPLRVVRFVGVVTSQQFEQYLADTAARFRRGERFVSIFDLTRGGVPTLEHRHQQTAWLQEYSPLLRELLLGVAFVATSPLIRLSLSAIFYFQPLPAPYVVTSRFSEAASWAIARLQEQGLTSEAEHLRHHFGLVSEGPEAPAP
jgi:hypothetical protein